MIPLYPKASIKFIQANLLGEGADIRLPAMYGFRSKGLHRFELDGKFKFNQTKRLFVCVQLLPRLYIG